MSYCSPCSPAFAKPRLDRTGSIGSSLCTKSPLNKPLPIPNRKGPLQDSLQQ
eukprot:Awhi_evm1s13348